jgi:diacylglycerol O-acyltransferase/trehalose O-mycolyltransferase
VSTEVKRYSGFRRLSALAAVVVAVVSALTAVALPTTAAASPAAIGGPVHRMQPGAFQTLLVPSSMGPMAVQVQWARRGGGAALYLLDGMKARNDENAWVLNTNARQQFSNDNVTLVMPIGGAGSFYTDWVAPSNFNGQQVTYKWETFLTQELPSFLAKYGVSRTDDGIVGLSMAGSSALSLAAHHRDQFKFAASFSGALDLTAPGSREFLRLALLDSGGYNIDDMWGPPWADGWGRNDPFTFAPALRGLPMFISCGDGIPQASDLSMAPGDLINGMALEVLVDVSTHAFETKMTADNIPATWDFTQVGVHSWVYWQAELWKARPQILQALGA